MEPIAVGEGGMVEEAQVLTKRTDEEQKLLRAAETIRPELNIEKHADFIFIPSHSKNVGKPRSRTWLETLPDGTKVKATISIETMGGKTPTTKTRKVYLALQKLTEDNGWNEDERTHFSLYDVSQIVGLKWAGTKTVKEIRGELLKLRGNLITWNYSFTDEDGHKIAALDTFNILDHLKIIEKRERTTNQLFLSLSSFRFHEEIRKNLKANHRKPTNLVALEIQGEIASVLYARLDVILADKPQYERATTGLFQDLQLEGSDYHKPSVRKRKLEKATAELEGKPISTGILSFSFEKTADGKDWKLIARKLPFFATKPRAVIPQRVAPANPSEAIPYLAQDIGHTIGQHETNHPLYLLLCNTYSQDVLYQALSEWKADGGREARNPRGYFMAILHRIAHERGKLWLNKNCPADCKYRPPIHTA